MRIIECDRCHKRISNDTEKTGYVNLDMRDVRTGDLDGSREFDLWDLCEECMKEIRDFVKQKSDNKPKATIKRPISADTKYAAITSEKIGRIKELVREGKTVKEIAELVGVSDPTVRKYKAEVAIETSDCLSESDQKIQ
jgi:hypothetical protein